jgi:quercetin dioxygenase-like cupin family protein
MQVLRLLAVVLMGATGMAPHPAIAQQSALKRMDLSRNDMSIPGREALQVVIEIAPGQASPRHTHPGEEIIYGLEGDLEYEVAGKVVRVGAGDVLFVPAGVPHVARNRGAGRGAELSTYVVEKGKPLLTVVD